MRSRSIGFLRGVVQNKQLYFYHISISITQARVLCLIYTHNA